MLKPDILQGAYFDATPLTLATWTAEEAPRLRRLAFCQDLLPNHGVERKETPAFGLHELEEAIDEASGTTLPEMRHSRRNDNNPMDFAQPIVRDRLRLGVAF